MVKIAIFDDERVIVDYIEELIRKYIKQDVRIYKYIDIQKFKKDFKKGVLQERCHQSYIVNLGRVRELNPHEAILSTG